MENCSKCNGVGLVGGDASRPYILEGKQSTCDQCHGTGKTAEKVVESEL